MTSDRPVESTHWDAANGTYLPHAASLAGLPREYPESSPTILTQGYLHLTRLMGAAWRDAMRLNLSTSSSFMCSLVVMLRRPPTITV